MSEFLVRVAVGADAEAVAGLREVVYPFLVVSAERLRRDIGEPPPQRRAGAWAAFEGDELVGFASCGLNTWTSETGIAGAGAYVHPDHRHRGIGSALAERVDVHLEQIGAKRVQAFVNQDSVGFAQARGYAGNREMHYVSLDLSTLPPAPPVPDGFRLVTAAEAGPELMYAADAAATLDEPSDAPADAIAYDDWLREIWDGPTLRWDLSIAAIADGPEAGGRGEVAAFTAVEAYGDRAWSGMTGTLRRHRGRGLAKLVKVVALRKAAEAGIRTAATSMDRRNGPMQAVNTWLGYRHAATQLGMTRTLG